MAEEIVPEPLDPATRQALALEREIWSAGRVLHHIHDIAHAPNGFNPGRGRGRFHPLGTPAPVAIPTLYGGDTLIGALCETLFRLEPAARPLRPFPVPKKRVLQSAYAKLSPARSLALVRLGGDNLRLLGLVRAQLLEPGPSHYERTALWATALHTAYLDIDGLLWRSRQHDESECVILFGDRVHETELDIAEEVSFEPPSGWQLLLDAAARAGIAITEP